MKLRSGQMAPAFSANDLLGRAVALDAYRGQLALLSFYRAAACPFCSLRAYHLIQRAPAYQRLGLNLVAFFEVAPNQALRYLDRLQAPYPIILDPDHTIYDRYGLDSSTTGMLRAMLARFGSLREADRRHLGAGANLMEMTRYSGGSLARLPGDFLIGPDGRILLAYYGRDAGDFLLFRDLEAAAFGAPLEWERATNQSVLPQHAHR